MTVCMLGEHCARYGHDHTPNGNRTMHVVTTKRAQYSPLLAIINKESAYASIHCACTYRYRYPTESAGGATANNHDNPIGYRADDHHDDDSNKYLERVFPRAKDDLTACRPQSIGEIIG